jgi:transposase
MSETGKKYKKHDYSKRLQIVAKVLEDHLPVRTAARLFEVDSMQVKYWVAMYSRYGEEGLRMRTKYYPGDFKYKVLYDLFENQLTLFATALKYGIPSPSTVLMWKRKYEATGLCGLYEGKQLWTESMATEKKNPIKQETGASEANNKETRDLLREINFLKAENAYLKKLRALVQERIARENQKGRQPSGN